MPKPGAIMVALKNALPSAMASRNSLPCRWPTMARALTTGTYSKKLPMAVGISTLSCTQASVRHMAAAAYVARGFASFRWRVDA
eukprot:scaffold3753_cov257-Pinguiococcus_pyrenoidosus.AAC.6